jgi:hypothetical protein
MDNREQWEALADQALIDPGGLAFGEVEGGTVVGIAEWAFEEMAQRWGSDIPPTIVMQTPTGQKVKFYRWPKDRPLPSDYERPR